MPPSSRTAVSMISRQVLFLADVTGDGHGLAARVLDEPDGLLGVLLLLRQVGDQDVCAFTGEGDGDGPADARITAGDDGSAIGQLARPAVGLLTVVGLVGHVGGQPRMRDVLPAGGVGLVVLCCRISGCVLVAGHSSLRVLCGDEAHGVPDVPGDVVTHAECPLRQSTNDAPQGIRRVGQWGDAAGVAIPRTQAPEGAVAVLPTVCLTGRRRRPPVRAPRQHRKSSTA